MGSESQSAASRAALGDHPATQRSLRAASGGRSCCDVDAQDAPTHATGHTAAAHRTAVAAPTVQPAGIKAGTACRPDRQSGVSAAPGRTWVDECRQSPAPHVATHPVTSSAAAGVGATSPPVHGSADARPTGAPPGGVPAWSHV